MKNLVYGILLFAIGQILVYFQTNGQFLWPWFKNNPWIIAIIGGTIISYTLIIGTNELAKYYDGALWPGRLIGFAIGMIFFSVLTHFIMNENMNVKTWLSLGLATIIIGIQLFWK